MSKKLKQPLHDAATQEFNKALDKEAKAWVNAHVQAFREIEAEEAKAKDKPPIKRKSLSSTNRKKCGRQGQRRSKRHSDIMAPCPNASLFPQLEMGATGLARRKC